MKYRLTHIGAEDCVTGSCHLIQADGLNVMIDCGLSQGDDPVSSLDEWPISPREIHFLFLTHAHIDHIGRLPDLIDAGFTGEIICTHPTKELLIPMLEDAMGFTRRDRYQKEKISKKINRLSWGFEYGKIHDLRKGIRFRLSNAGHIMGSCFIRFQFDEKRSVIFSGDLGAKDTPILPDPRPPESCELLVLESTYGDRLHPDRTDRIRQLGEILSHSLSDGGKIFIPAFALGRTQELIYEMDRLFSDPDWQKRFPLLQKKEKIPVFVDSPLGVRITRIYSGLAPYWDDEATKIKRSGDHPIDFSHLIAVGSHAEHEKLLEMKGPAVILAGSGMCTGGRILNHLREGLTDPKNDILFVGFQGKGTLGRRIRESGKKKDGSVTIHREETQVKAGVYSIGAYSAHADRKGLVDWVESMPEKPEHIKLVHGEDDARKALAATLKKRGYNVSP